MKVTNNKKTKAILKFVFLAKNSNSVFVATIKLGSKETFEKNSLSRRLLAEIPPMLFFDGLFFNFPFTSLSKTLSATLLLTDAFLCTFGLAEPLERDGLVAVDFLDRVGELSSNGPSP